MKKRILSLALALTMALALVPTAALAAVDDTVIEIVPCIYDETRSFSEGKIAVKRNGKWGFLDTTGQEVIPVQYDEVGDFSENMAAVMIIGQGWGYIDQSGNQVIPCKYAEAEAFQEGFAAVCAGEYPNKKWGFVDAAGNEIAPCKYDAVRAFCDGLAAVKLDSGRMDAWRQTIYNWGFIDGTGNEVIPLKYHTVYDFSEGLATVELDSGEKDERGRSIYKWGFIDKTGSEVIPCTYVRAESFSEGLAAVALDSGESSQFNDIPDPIWGYIDATGRKVIPCIYSNVNKFSGGLAAVYLTDGYDPFFGGISKLGFIDATGRVVVPFDTYSSTDSTRGLSGGFMAVRLGIYPHIKYGFIDTTGKEVTPCMYDNIIQGPSAAGWRWDGFSEGFAAVERDGKWGFVDATGKEVIPCKYEYEQPEPLVSPGRKYYGGVFHFSEGYAAVKQNDEWIFIDTAAQEFTLPKKYDHVECFDQGLVRVQMNDKYGFVGWSSSASNGPQIIPTQFDLSDLDPSLGFQLEGTVLVKYTGPGGNVTIPEGVTEIGPEAFRDCTALTGLIIPDTVVKMDYSALYGCSCLTSITIPNGLSLRLVNELQSCVRLTDITYGRMSDQLKYNLEKYKQWVNPGSYLGGTYRQIDDIVIAQSNQIVSDAGAVTDYEKLKAICIWIASNIRYDLDYKSKSAKTVLNDRRAVCQGYSALTQDMLQAQGIPCFEVYDYTGEGHVWNQAFADGRWVIVDTTWMKQEHNGSYSHFDMSIFSVSGLAYHEYQSYPSTRAENIPSDWAQDETWGAICAYLVPYDLQANYRENITREEFCRLVVKLVEQHTGQTAANYAAAKGLSITDPFSDTDAPDILAAHALGIVNGTSPTTFNPNGSITRQEAAAMLTRTAKLLGLTAGNGDAFNDVEQAADWVKESVSFVSALTDPTTGNKVMGGTGNGNFSPLGTYTREQAYLASLRLFHCAQ